MSYARFSYSDIYVFMNFSKQLECCACLMAPPTVRMSHRGASYYSDSTEKMINHIKEHRLAGHKVPETIEEDLLKDDERNFYNDTKDTKVC